MSKGLEINIRKSISTAINETASDLVGMLIIVFIFGFAFAPWFAPFFRNYLEKKYDVNNHTIRIHIVDNQMRKVKLLLWSICIIAWTVILGTYAYENA